MDTRTDLVTVPKPDADDWWRGAVIYQIYPRSFQDGNSDGIGDLAGIAQRLAHVASLGVDAIWISPFFPSPMKDFGYDISDYCDVDPMFGTLGDFTHLMETAHGLGLKVLIDLVMSHSSDQHPWFVESSSSRDNPKADWYVWADPKPDGTPPNNWLSIFGGSAWQWDAGRLQYYLHNFLVEQPDLNFHCTEVQDKLLETAKFWLDRGVDGFRLDTINFYFADKELRDNPALPPEERNEQTAPAVNPYNYQRHVYSKTQPENLDFLRRLRALTDQYPGRTLLGEVGESQRGLEVLGEYTEGDDKVHMCYAFEFLENRALTAARIVEVFQQFDKVAADGWACWAMSNHDVVRHMTRWALNDASARVYLLLMLFVKGSACIYQGEELGLGEAEVPYEALQDPYAKRFWPEFKGRDGCRTPMVWDAQAVNGGFSDAVPWLPVYWDHVGHAVASAELDPAAILHHYRRAIAFRRAHPVLRGGDQVNMRAEGDVLSFERKSDDEHLFIAINLSDRYGETAPPAGEWESLAPELNGAGLREDGRVPLGAWQPAILRRL